MRNILLMPLLVMLTLMSCREKNGKENQSISHSGIDTVESLTIGGMEQTVLIRGDDTRNPVLLLLHGGPGFSEFMFFRTYNKALEKDFIVVNWDQCGTHLSYNDSIPEERMTTGRFVRDTRELMGMLKERFQKEKIFLLGHGHRPVHSP